MKWIWEGFQALSGSRQRGFSGLQPLSITEIYAYVSYNEIYDDDDREDFLYHVQQLDHVFIKKIDEKVKASSKKK